MGYSYVFKNVFNLTPEETIIVKRASKIDDELKMLEKAESNREENKEFSYPVKYSRMADFTITDTGKLRVLVKKSAKIYQFVDVETYCHTDDSANNFLWRMFHNDLRAEVELRERKNMIEVKGVIGSSSKIVGKLPDDIYQKVKDKALEGEFEFIANPKYLCISLYEITCDFFEFDDIAEFRKGGKYYKCKY